MARPRKKQSALTVLLLKDGLDEKIALKDGAALERFSVKDGKTRVGVLYIASPTSNPPRWQGYISAYVSGMPALTNRSNKAVMFVPAGGRLFAITFGHGRALLASDVIEDGFGLRVTLNTVPEDEIRTISKRSLDAFAHHTLTQALRTGRLGQFGVDLEQDLLQAVTGVPGDPTLGVRVVGKDALGLVTRATIPDLPALFARYADEFASTAYRTKYPDIDKMAEEQDAGIVAKLEADLLAKFAEGDFERLWLAVPEIIEWGEVVGFRYSETGKELYADLHATEFLKHVRDPVKLSIARLKQKRAYAIDGESDLPRYHWPVFRCIHFETKQGKDSYVLSGGKWFRLEKDFVKIVNDYVSPLLGTSSLPAFDHKDEGEYNEEAAKKRGVVLMDKAMVHHGGGHSSLEFCDLFNRQREMIHVKRYAGSGVMSHLFSQGGNAAEALLLDAEFRTKVRKVLPTSHRSLVPARKIDPAAFKVIYGIIGRPLSGKTLAQGLPFFSRVTLRRVAQRLVAAGFDVTVAWIPKK
jgi:uncharacterized protein (TIGR04141 family)